MFGAGSIGCYLGGQLAGAGVSVLFIGRPKMQQVLNTSGVTLTHFERDPMQVSADDFTFKTAIDAGDAPDIVLVTVKSQDTREAGQTLARHLPAETLIVSFQNGASNADVLRQSMPGFTVLGAMVPFNVTVIGSGRFHCGTEGDLCVEHHPSARLERLIRAFGRAGQCCVLSNRIDAVLWGKLLVNLNNAMNALYGGPLKAGLLQRDYRRALAAMIEEALGILRCAGIEPEKFGKTTPEKMIRILRFPNFIYRILMNVVVKIDASARSSMLDDLDAGRQSEVDYLQGEIVRLATSIQRNAPINSLVLSLVNDAFARGVSPRMSGSAIWAAVNPTT